MVVPKDGVKRIVTGTDTPQIFLVQFGAVDLHVVARTQDELEAEVANQLSFLWRMYATADDADLAPDALVLKTRLLATFHVAQDLAEQAGTT